MAENVGYVIGKQNNDALCTMTESRSSSPTNLLQRSDMFSRECSRHFQFSGQHFHGELYSYAFLATLQIYQLHRLQKKRIRVLKEAVFI